MTKDFDALIKEYEVLRSEIDMNLTHAERITGYTFVALAGLLGSQKWIADNPNLSIMLLIFPIVFALLGFLFLDKILRVNRLADYIHNSLRRKLLRHCKDPVMQWEVYKKHFAAYPGLLIFGVNVSRILLFVLPGILSLAIYFISRPTLILNNIEWVLFLIDLAVIGGIVDALSKINETPGVNIAKDIDCDQHEPEHVFAELKQNDTESS